MLNELLIQEIEETEQYEGFKIENLEQANWAFRKIRAYKVKVAENNLLAEAEIQRIEAWRTKEIASAESTITFFEGLLTDYFRRLREEDPKAKVSTPYGKISSRKSAKWNYTDEESLTKWLKDNAPDLIRVKEEVNKAELKKIFKNGLDSETGEVVPGIVVSEEETISIKTE